MSSSASERASLINRIYNINEKDFDTVAIDLWRYQYKHNNLYQFYCNLLSSSPLKGTSIEQIPFLPISFFRGHKIQTGHWQQEKIFRSSGTTGSIRSAHFIRDIDWYHQMAKQSFERSLGDPSSYIWLALLPSYLESQDSSLINMVDYFMHIDKRPESDFFSAVDQNIIQVLQDLESKHQKTILIGVSFALMDLFENYEVPVWDQLTVIETGGMKGRGPEITREELHGRLKLHHPQLKIGSEYGMTELLSQAYLVADRFQPAPTMKILVRDISDPLSLIAAGKRGAINVIDLANIDSCSFIATDDTGVVFEDGSFDVLGRVDQSDIRGCNLMYA